MLNVFYTIFAITLSLALGKLVNYALGGLPASLYGMIIYSVLLQLNWLNPNKISKVNQWFIKHMGVFFVPAGVGIINHFSLIEQHGIALIAIIFISTFILLTSVGLLSEKFICTPKDMIPKGISSKDIISKETTPKEKITHDNN